MFLVQHTLKHTHDNRVTVYSSSFVAKANVWLSNLVNPIEVLIKSTYFHTGTFEIPHSSIDIRKRKDIICILYTQSMNKKTMSMDVNSLNNNMKAEFMKMIIERDLICQTWAERNQ